MVDYWAERMVVTGAGLRAGQMAVKMVAKRTSVSDVNWVDYMVG